MSLRDQWVLYIVDAFSIMSVALAGLTAVPGRALAVPCETKMLSDYLNLNSCTIGAFTLKDFNYDALNAGIDAKTITVTPVTGPDGIGSRFTFPQGELFSNGRERALRIDFTITDMSVDPLITAARLTMQAEFTGSGVARVTDPLPLSTTLQTNVTNLESQHTFPNLVHFVLFSSRVSAETGVAVAGTVRVSQYTETIQPVPEPPTGILILIGATCFALACHRATRTRKALAGRFFALLLCDRKKRPPYFAQ